MVRIAQNLRIEGKDLRYRQKRSRRNIANSRLKRESAESAQKPASTLSPTMRIMVRTAVAPSGRPTNPLSNDAMKCAPAITTVPAANAYRANSLIVLDGCCGGQAERSLSARLGRASTLLITRALPSPNKCSTCNLPPPRQYTCPGASTTRRLAASQRPLWSQPYWRRPYGSFPRFHSCHHSPALVPQPPFGS